MPVALSAQTLRGVVVDQLDRPLAGVVLQLTDTTTRVVVRTLSNERGEFRLTAPSAGQYRIRSARVGYRPFSTDLIALAAGAEVTRRVALTSNPVVLDAVTSTVRTSCRLLGLDSTAATFLAWEQVRAALLATDVTAETRQFSTTTLSYDRTQNLEGNLVRQAGRVSTAAVTQPWHSVAADSLRKVGYAVMESDSTRVFHGPDVRVLASDTFLEDHCFQLVPSDDPQRIGIAFQPTPQRRNLPEIQGTVWLDRGTSELRDMEWQYMNIAKNIDDTATGGVMQFARLRTGAWVISRWHIRMPLVVMSGPTQRETVSFRGVKIVGGEVVSASSSGGQDTLWAGPKMAMRGFAFDSLNRKAMTAALVGIAGSNRTTVTDSSGHFQFDSLPPGAYRLLTQHEGLEAVGISQQTTHAVLATADDFVNITVPSLETIWRSTCGSSAPGKDTALVYGTVRGVARTRPVRGATVMASWVDVVATKAKGGFGTKRWRLDGVSDSTGRYVLCGVPTQTGIRMRAVIDSAESGLVDVPPITSHQIHRRDFLMSYDPKARGVVMGKVIGRNAIPIAGARVAAEGVNETRSDAEGRFILHEVPLGTQQVEVLAVGLQPISTIVDVSLVDTTRLELHVTKPVMLQRVNIVASGVRQQFVTDFNFRKTKGLGTFRDSTVISRHGTLNGALAEIPGVRMEKNQIMLPRVGFTADTVDIVSKGCLAILWIDGVKVQSQDDLQALRPSDIAVVEVYQRELAVPAQFLVRVRTPQCGVIVVWTKWFWEGNQSTRPPR